MVNVHLALEALQPHYASICNIPLVKGVTTIHCILQSKLMSYIIVD
jgi:hypothetical protein